MALGNIRVALTFDYAVTPNILIGARVGVALLHSPSDQGFNVFGSGAPLTLLAEGRFTYLFSGVTAPLSPYIQLAVGVSQYDAAVTVAGRRRLVGGRAQGDTPDHKVGPAAGATRNKSKRGRSAGRSTLRLRVA